MEVWSPTFLWICSKNNPWNGRWMKNKHGHCFVVYDISCVISHRILNWRCHWLTSEIVWFDTISCLGLSYDNVVTAKVHMYNVNVWRTKVTLKGTYLLLHTTKSGTRLLRTWGKFLPVTIAMSTYWLNYVTGGG